MMGVLIMLPYTPPLLMVKVPPAMSSMLIVPSLAFLPSAPRFFSMPAKLSCSRHSGSQAGCAVRCLAYAESVTMEQFWRWLHGISVSAHPPGPDAHLVGPSQDWDHQTLGCGHSN